MKTVAAFLVVFLVAFSAAKPGGAEPRGPYSTPSAKIIEGMIYKKKVLSPAPGAGYGAFWGAVLGTLVAPGIGTLIGAGGGAVVSANTDEKCLLVVVADGQIVAELKDSGDGCKNVPRPHPVVKKVVDGSVSYQLLP